MSSNYGQVLQAALQLPPDDRLRLREALEEAEDAMVGSVDSPRISGLNQHEWISYTQVPQLSHSRSRPGRGYDHL